MQSLTEPNQKIKLIEESPVFPAGRGTPPLSVLLRHNGLEYVVHYRNHEAGGYYQDLYTKSLPVAHREFADRVERLEKTSPGAQTPVVTTPETSSAPDAMEDPPPEDYDYYRHSILSSVEE